MTIHNLDFEVQYSRVSRDPSETFVGELIKTRRNLVYYNFASVRGFNDVANSPVRKTEKSETSASAVLHAEIRWFLLKLAVVSLSEITTTVRKKCKYKKSYNFRVFIGSFYFSCV